MSKRKHAASRSASSQLKLNKFDQFQLSSKTPLKVHRFLGLSMSGGKTDKTSLAVLEYYPDHEKIFLSQLNEKIQTIKAGSSRDQTIKAGSSRDQPTNDLLADLSADLQIHQLITEVKKVKFLAVDAPLKLPKCMRCRLACPGYEVCTEEEMQWLRNNYRKLYEKRKPKKLFTPYTERCCESYISSQLEEVFHPPHALGANMAPLAARAHFIARRVKVPKIEVYPKLSLWRIGRSLKIQKMHLRAHKHAFEGQGARQAILEKLIDNDIAFIYRQDQKSLIENNHSFEAFLCALTAVLKFRNQVEKRPVGFPKGEAWIDIPKENILWK